MSLSARLDVLHDDRHRAGSFGEDAEQYDRARPSYPAPLIDDLAHAVLAHRRSGREMPEALRVFADFFGPVPSGATPPPSDV